MSYLILFAFGHRSFFEHDSDLVRKSMVTCLRTLKDTYSDRIVVFTGDGLAGFESWVAGACSALDITVNTQFVDWKNAGTKKLADGREVSLAIEKRTSILLNQIFRFHNSLESDIKDNCNIQLLTAIEAHRGASSNSGLIMSQIAGEQNPLFSVLPQSALSVLSDATVKASASKGFG